MRLSGIRHWLLGIGHQVMGIKSGVMTGRILPRICILMVLPCCFSPRAAAQEIKISSGFLSDSLKIGEETAFYLAAHYRSDLNVLFPDSTHAFAPFEYMKRNYFATKTIEGTSLDSAVYYLTTFEVDRVQKLNLPVYIVQARDCTVVQSPSDSVLITQLVAEVPDSLSIDKLPLKMNTAYQKVFFQFNFWIVLIAVGLVIIVAILVWIFFAKRIRQYFRERRMKKRHARFVKAFTGIVEQLQTTFSALTTENALSLWKKYMEQLEARPYTKLTTKETQNIIHDDHLMQNLRIIDTAIYGHDTSVYDSLNFLKNFADQRFSKKIEELNHGK